MRRTLAYSFSLTILLLVFLPVTRAQDTVIVPLKLRVGIEASGPAIYLSEKKNQSYEGYVSVDMNEKLSVMAGGGFLNYQYSQYNYNYLSKGIFFRAGTDFNLLGPVKAQGKYWAGIGLHYGFSSFTSQVPSFERDNYWGTVISSIPGQSGWAHFVEATPGARAEIFRNFSVGWTISLRMLLLSSKNENIRPLYLPGFGSGGKNFSSGISYFLVWNIPFKKITVITKPEPQPEQEEETGAPGQNTITRPGQNQQQPQPSIIRP